MQAVAQQQQMEQQAQGVEMAKGLGQASTAPDTALGDLKEAIGPA